MAWSFWCGNLFFFEEKQLAASQTLLVGNSRGRKKSAFHRIFLSYLFVKQSVMTRTARICSRTIRMGHFSSETIEGGAPTESVEYFVKRLSYETRAHNIISALCTPIQITSRKRLYSSVCM